ncbi:MAG: aminotransferase class V-fold PLP-dependent enzyme, partial [Pseudomonadales bacterium]|nr:aminotransferase class V-fold PLP-dependent enzyme [Pseudomonadales bacterium]
RVTSPMAAMALATPISLLTCIMDVNNEIGVVNDIAAIGEVTREANVYFHVDAAQSAGKIDIDLQAMKVDLMSFSAHKVYGPKGMGALFVRRHPRVRLEALIHGGGHEREMRSGTLATHPIVGIGEAFRLAREQLLEEGPRILDLRERLWNGIRDMDAVHLNGHPDRRVPGILNVSFGYVDGETLLMSLGTELAVSSGSACTSASIEPSYVLRALGLSDDLAHSSLRFSVGRFTTEEEVDYAIERVREVVGKLRESSPAWQQRQTGDDLSGLESASH